VWEEERVKKEKKTGLREDAQAFWGGKKLSGRGKLADAGKRDIAGSGGGGGKERGGRRKKHGDCLLWDAHKTREENKEGEARYAFELDWLMWIKQDTKRRGACVGSRKREAYVPLDRVWESKGASWSKWPEEKLGA